MSLAERRRAKQGRSLGLASNKPTMTFALPLAEAAASPRGLEDDTHQKEDLDALFERATMAAKEYPDYDPGQDTATKWEPGAY